MYIPQIQLENLKKKLEAGKVVVIFGPRRTGKTTLLEHYLQGVEDALFVNGEDRFVQEYLSSCSIEKLKEYIGNAKILIIDEAQKVENIGQNLKLIVDHLPHLPVIATGSFSFDLARNVGEPLTGRKKVLRLFPLSQMELNQFENLSQVKARLESRLIYGSYPEVVLMHSMEEKKEYLHEMVNSYLYKDIIELDGIKKAKKLVDLLQLIAFQIGKEVSYHELANRLGINKNTVERYLDLMEQVFILINIRGFSRNLRREVTKTSRYYFYDTGIRNALINNFNVLSNRNDVGQIWENYIVIERLKKQHYQQIWSNNYFWRTYDQKEIDWVEEREGKLHGYEIKWSPKSQRAPKLWKETYLEATYQVIHPDNYLEFIG